MANKRQCISLPEEIIFSSILTKLPVKSLCRSKAVCRKWRALISSKAFIRAQVHHAKDTKSYSFHKYMYLGFRLSIGQVYSYFLDFSRTFEKSLLVLPFGDKCVNCEVLASCDGLLLLHKGLKTYVLWNPSTGEFREFYGLHMNKSVGAYCRFYGIAYEKSSNTYKIISGARIDNSAENTIISVFNCRTQTCKYTSSGFSYWIFKNQQGVTINDTPHWLVSRGQGGGVGCCAIIYYDLATETFKEVAKPEWADDDQSAELELRAHAGSLCLVRYRRGYADVWAMERESGWRNVYPYVTCLGKSEMRPLGLTHGGCVVVELQQRKVSVYDPRTRVFAPENVFTFPNSDFSSATFVESLVSPTQIKD